MSENPSAQEGPVSTGLVPDFLAGLPERIVNLRGLVIAVFLGLLVGLGAYSQHFVLNQSLAAFFHDDDPTLREYDWFKLIFGSDEFLMIVIKPKSGDVFAPQSLARLAAIETALKAKMNRPGDPLNQVTRVRSIVSADDLVARDDVLLNQPFVGDRLPQTTAASEALRQRAFTKKEWPGFYFARDSSLAVMVLQTSFGLGGHEVPQVAAAAEAQGAVAGFDFSMAEPATRGIPAIADAPHMIETLMDAYPPFLNGVLAVFAQEGLVHNQDFFLAGNPRIMTYFYEVVLKEIGMFAAMAVVIIWLVMLVTFRSFSALVWPSVILITSGVMLFGIIGLSGREMTFMINIIIFLLLAVSIATSIHIINGYVYFVREGYAPVKALCHTYHKAGVAILLAGLTTALGLASLMFVPIPAIENFGLFACTGVLLCVAINLVMWPVFLSYWAPRIAVAATERSILDRFLATQSQRVANYRRPILVVFALITVTMGWGMQYVEIDSNYINMVRRGEGVSETYEFIDQAFGGTASMEVLLDTGRQDGVKDPTFLRMVDRLSGDLEDGFALITRVQSLARATKDANKSLHNDDDGFYRIPDTKAAVSQVLFSLEAADPKSRRLLVDDNWQLLRLNISVKTAGSSVYLDLKEKIAKLVAERVAPFRSPDTEIAIHFTGNLPLMMGMVSLISESQIRSFSLPLGVICVVMFLVFRSVRLGFLAMIPNIFPLVMVMGFAGFMGIPLDTDTLLVVPIAIGIAVDDTIHFLSHFQAEIAEGYSVEEAVHNSLVKVGRAMFFTTVVLSLGFSVYLLSVYKPLVNFGVMAALAVTSALCADIFLLPELLGRFYKPKGVKHMKAVVASGAVLCGLLGIGMMTKPAAAAGVTAAEIAGKMLDRDLGRSQFSQGILVSCQFKVVAGTRKCASAARKKEIETVGLLRSDGRTRSTLNIVLAPASDKGIAFLQEDFETKRHDSQQWMFLPSLRKVKRIVSAGQNSPKTGTLFGSEIAYEDIEKTYFDDYRYQLLGEAEEAGRPSWQLESTPSPKRKNKTSYAKNITWVDKESYVPLKSEHYGHDGRLLKTYFSQGLEQKAGVWIAKQMIVVNHESQRMSLLQRQTIKINVSVPEGLVTQKALEDSGFRESLIGNLR